MARIETTTHVTVIAVAVCDLHTTKLCDWPQGFKDAAYCVLAIPAFQGQLAEALPEFRREMLVRKVEQYLDLSNRPFE